MLLEQCIERVRSYFNLNDFTKSGIAKYCGLKGEGTIRWMHEDGWSPTTKILRKMEQAIPEGWEIGDPVDGDRAHKMESEAA